MNHRVAMYMGLLALLSSCTSSPSAFPQGDREFNELVSSWVQVGMAAPEAKAKLESQGLKIFHGTERDREWIIGSKKKSEGFVCDREWRAVLYTKQGQVTQVDGFVVLTCL